MDQLSPSSKEHAPNLENKSSQFHSCAFSWRFRDSTKQIGLGPRKVTEHKIWAKVGAFYTIQMKDLWEVIQARDSRVWQIEIIVYPWKIAS